MRHLIVSLVLSFVLAHSACDAPSVVSSADAAPDVYQEADDASGPAVTPGQDVTGPSADTLGDTATADGGDEENFILGVNVTGQNHPQSFSELAHDGELFVELGAQGLWMVVLAFKTRDLFDDRVLLRASIEVDSEIQGELALAKQKLAAGGDGWDYYYNFFLIVPDPALAGQKAKITFKVQDDITGEIRVNKEHFVQLTGGME